jgi:pyrimidine-nucleoside phosphorylase
MSGRGLGISGGTIDKLESIPGFCANLTTEEFLEQLRTIGLVVTGQSVDLAPADGKLYALRDVTGTVQSIPLIASSIMSKKIAGGAKAIVLDVKVGSGAFMKTLEEAKELATLMVDIGKLSRRKTVALLSDMSQPLGFAVGNALELKEAVQALQKEGPPDFIEHCITVAEHMLMLGGKATEIKEARSIAKHVLADGSAWDTFRQMVIFQKGDVNYIDDLSLLPKARYIETILSPSTGYLSEINAQMVGEAAVLLGAGRAKKGDVIDYAVGVVVHRKVGDYIEKNQPLFTIHANDDKKLQQGCNHLLVAHKWNGKPVDPLPLFYGIIS